ncbi:Kelch domain-containing protein 10 [Thelohanellus kitauei]|uniref:Kelch domain-containing protein 10 n=1 Tax=Thelohanellus kitauei TaxID=669202 RepID=A0A0C2IUW6_THEKT|nr:Kelch domain-containing protein 10 [Thelohanellus kitauei]
MYAFSSTYAYMSGGEHPDRTEYLLDIWRIDFETLEWVKLDKSLPRRLYYNHMSVVEDSILYHVGIYDMNSRYINALERFTIQLPSLFRICLEAICRSRKKIKYIGSLPKYIVGHLNLEN